MKTQIIIVIGVIACVALCAAVWPRSAKVEGLPVKQDIRVVYRDIGVMDSMEPVKSGEQKFEELPEQAESGQMTA